MALFLFLITLFQVSNNNTQLDYYISNLEKENSIVANAWSLNEILLSSCDRFTKFSNEIENSELGNIYADINCSEENLSVLSLEAMGKLAIKYDSPELSIIYIIKTVKTGEKDENYDEILSNIKGRYTKLANAIINKEKLNSEVLPFQSDLMVHFELLMSSSIRYDYYTTEYWENAVQEWDKITYDTDSEELEYAFLLAMKMFTSFLIDKYSIIYAHYNDFLAIDKFPDIYQKFQVLTTLDYGLYRLGYYDKSLKIQRNYSIPLAKKLKRQDLIDGVRIRQGGYLFNLGKYKESNKIYEELYSDSQSVYDQYILYTNLGANYLKLGQNNKYINFQLKALEEEIPEDRYESLLRIYRNLFIYYSQVKDINTALTYIDKAKEIANNNNNNRELALINSYLGSFYWSTYKDAEEALHHFESAKRVLSPNAYYHDYTDLLLEEANILTQIDSLQQSLSNLVEVKEMALSKSDTPKYIDALINEMIILLKFHDYSIVEKRIKEVKLYPLDDIDFELLVKYYTTIADYYYQTNSTREAIEQLAPVVEQIVEREKNNTDSQSGYWNVKEEYLEAFSLMVEMLIESESSKKAVTLLDQLKTINDATLFNSPLVKASKLSEQQLAEEKRLNESLQNLRKKYLNANEQDRFDLKAQIDQISAEREEILNNVNLNKAQKLSPIWSVQRLIKKDELVLHFTEISNDIYITELSFNDINIRKISLDKEEADLFSNTANDLGSGNTNLNDLYHIYQKLGLHSISKEFNHISVVPDNYLYRIPIEILPTEKPASPVSFGASRYLIEDFHFSYYSSLKEYEDNQRTKQNSEAENFSAFAISDFKNTLSANLPSLPYATIEVNNIGTTLTSIPDKNIYTGRRATKEAFKEELAKSRIVHVATHSEVSEQDPLFSTIYLNSQSADDSLESSQALYAYELFDTPFNSEFVMLNSCSSGSGNFIQGTGIMGITRALRYAGAKSLALNLWSVNDKVASQFAFDFYSHINNGATKSEAIRQAKLNQLKTANANPHFWGAYMLIGNSTPITEKPSRPMILFSLLAVTVLVIGYTSRKTAMLSA